MSVSIVSHDQAALVATLIADLDRVCAGPLELIVTENVPESVPVDHASRKFPIIVIRNDGPKGFGANHNQAFRRAGGAYFCVMNPDIRLETDPFPALVETLRDETVGVVGPLVKNPLGAVEDSARKFPHPLSILAKLVGFGGQFAASPERSTFYPDWIAGMFMLFKRDSLTATGGFDERYFLYYEDVDLCARLKLRGKRIAVQPAVTVVHDARRMSRRSARYLRWHLKSMLRFFLSPVFWQVMKRKLSP